MLKFLLFLAICGLATALQHKRSVESEFEETKNRQVCTVSTKTQHVAAFTINTPPTYTGIIPIKDAEDMNTRVTQAGDKLVLIFVMNEWCYFSRKVVPTVEEVAAMKDGHNKTKVVVLKVVSDMMDNENTNWKYGVNEVSGWPTFIFVKSGEKVKKFSGANSARSSLRRTVDELTITTRRDSEQQDE